MKVSQAEADKILAQWGFGPAVDFFEAAGVSRREALVMVLRTLGLDWRKDRQTYGKAGDVL